MKKRVSVCAFCVFLIVSSVVNLFALRQVGAQAPVVQGPTDPIEMAAFFDGIMLYNLEKDHIAGVTVVVVKDGEVFFSQGYGYADVEKRIAVDPETTLFRIGSVSKLFTWTAVMQLVEQGKLNLDADVNTYLDFTIPATYPEPITLKHLLTHTPGFEDRGYDMMAATAGDMVSLGAWLKTHIPARVRPAGTFAAYSNYGTTLAGYIVERVSGMSYDDYIEQNLLQPLGMLHTSTRQPLPETLVADMALGYKYENGTYAAEDFEIILPAPAGSVSSSALDMARFMMAHLQYGRYGDAQILQEATARQMQTRIFAHDERINGMAHGFYELDRNGHDLIGHGGDTLLFHSQLALLPEQNVGFFVSCNSVECAGLPEKLMAAFVDHYYPAAESPASTTADFDQRAGLLAGTYRMNRMSYTTAESIGGLFSTIDLNVDDGRLLLKGLGVTLRFVEVEPFVFRSENGQMTLVFREDPQGVVAHAFIGDYPFMAFDKVGGLDTPLLHFALLGISGLLFFSALTVWPLVFLARLGYEKKPQAALAPIARWVAAGLSLLCLIFAVLGIVGVSDSNALMTGDVLLQGAQPVIFWSIVAASLGALVFTFFAWKDRYWSFVGRVHYTLVMLAGWGFVWFVNYWHLLHW